MQNAPKLLDDLLSVYDDYRTLTRAISKYKDIAYSTTWRLHNLKIKKAHHRHQWAIEKLWANHFET